MFFPLGGMTKVPYKKSICTSALQKWISWGYFRFIKPCSCRYAFEAASAGVRISMAGVLFCADAGASGEAGSSVSREWMPNIFDIGCLLSVQQVCAFSAQTIRIYSDGRYPVHCAAFFNGRMP